MRHKQSEDRARMGANVDMRAGTSGTEFLDRISREGIFNARNCLGDALKALVLAAGRGSRFGELTTDENKCMLKPLGKPILDYNMENAARTSAREIVLVVGHKSEDIMERYRNAFMGKPIRYVLQAKLLGL